MLAFQNVTAPLGAKGCDTVKTMTCLSLFVVGALLQGCAQGSSSLEIDEFPSDTDDTEEIRNDGPASQASAREGAVDAKIATLKVPGGQVIFVDEGLTEPGGGIAFWEVGGADLSYLLDDQNATALEVYMALTPVGTPVPERLVEHHAEVARRVGGIAAEPRRLAIPFALPAHSSLTNEGLNDGNSDSDKDCWGWAGTSTPYSSKYGYQGFNELVFQGNFNTQYSQISGSFVTDGHQSATSLVEESTLGPTAAGHERAMAFCLSKAAPATPGDSLTNVCYTNEATAQVTVERTTDSTYASYSTADMIELDSFGHGGRFRSNYTNSGGAARKYRITVLWTSQTEAPACLDEIVLAWRSRQILTGPGGVTN